jgi:hypothetical protein
MTSPLHIPSFLQGWNDQSVGRSQSGPVQSPEDYLRGRKLRSRTADPRNFIQEYSFGSVQWTVSVPSAPLSTERKD